MTLTPSTPSSRSQVADLVRLLAGLALYAGLLLAHPLAIGIDPLAGL